MTKRIAYKGPENSDAHAAAEILAKRGWGFLECMSVRDIVTSIDEDTYGVVPFDTKDGSLQEIMFELANATNGAFVSKMCLVPVDYRIFAKKGITYQDYKRILITEYGYSMCKNNLKDMFPLAKIEYITSVSKAIWELNDNTTCVVAGVQNKNKDVIFGPTSIADDKTKGIKYAYIEKDKGSYKKDANRILVAATLYDKPGTLSRFLNGIADNCINISYISSQKQSIDFEESTIVVELEGNCRDKTFVDAVPNMAANAKIFKVVGCYQALTTLDEIDKYDEN